MGLTTSTFFPIFHNTCPDAMEWYKKSKRNSASSGTMSHSPGYQSLSGATNGGGVSPYSNQRAQFYNGSTSNTSNLSKLSGTNVAKNNISSTTVDSGTNSMSRTSYYLSQYPLYCCDWKSVPGANYENIALSTYNEGFSNRLQVVHGLPYGKDFVEADDVSDTGQYAQGNNFHYDENNLVQGYDFRQALEVSIDYPITNIQWDPAIGSNSSPCHRLAASSEVLRLYKVEPDYEQENEFVLSKTHTLANNTAGNTVSSSSNSSSSGHNNPSAKDDINTYPPVTSFDWNKTDPTMIITSSVDTTCTVWDLHRSYTPHHLLEDTTGDLATVKTQLIAHDSEVFDVKFISNSTNIFASVGNDGSMRVFDLRSLEHSTIIYEPSSIPLAQGLLGTGNSNLANPAFNSKALLRLSTSNIDQHHLATIGINSNQVIIIDMRMPGLPVATLDGSFGGINQAAINLIQWHPSANYLLTGGDDCQALIWDCNKLHQVKTTLPTNSSEAGLTIDTPVLAYDEELEVNNATWRGDQGDWIGVVSGKGFQAVQL